MKLNEAILKYNLLSCILFKENDNELSKDLKVKLMTMRIKLGKIKKEFDKDSQEFVDGLVTPELKELSKKQDKTEEEIKNFKQQTASINSAYNQYMLNRYNEDVDINTSITEDEFNEIILVNCDNSVIINGTQISSGDYLETLYTVFVNE